MKRGVTITLMAIFISSCASRSAVQSPSSSSIAPFIQENPGTTRLWATFATEGGSQPTDVALGSDGAMWVSENAADAIERFDVTTGTTKHYPTPNAPLEITAGPDGNVWFTEPNAMKLGRITPAGTVTEFSPPSQGYLFDVTGGSDGDVWFAESPDIIGAVSPEGTFREYHNPSGHPALLMTSGPDGAIWFTETNYDEIGRVSTTGQFTEFALPAGRKGPFDIISFEGELWFTELISNAIAKMTTSGQVTEFPVHLTFPSSLCAGPNGFLWFVHDADAGKLANFNPKTDTATNVGFAPGTSGGYGNVAVGPDKNIYTGAPFDDEIVVRVIDVMTATPSSLDLTVGQSQDFTLTENHYAGSWSAVSSKPSVAKVSQPAKGTFKVTGVNSGSTTVTVSDSIGNSKPVPVTVH